MNGSVEQMKLGDIARKRLHFLTILMAAFAVFMAPQAAMAQDEVAPAVSAEVADSVSVVEAAYTQLGPEMIKGQPTSFEDDWLASMSFQEQFSPNGEYAVWMHDAILMPLIVGISIFVLFLLLWLIVRFNKRRNPVPSRTTHNTFIEIIWTLVPVLILIGVAVPSLTLLSAQYESAPEDALTIKVTGYQWYWGYGYPDNGDFEVISNMMPEEEAAEKGLPRQLAVDNRMVVPFGETIRIQTTGADVIHSFSIPSLWFKIDSVPGRLNEKTMFIKEEGIYYGQCSELCGARHGYMPIAIEAVSREKYEQWVLSKGGSLGVEEELGAEEELAEAVADEASEGTDADAEVDDEGEEAVEAV